MNQTIANHGLFMYFRRWMNLTIDPQIEGWRSNAWNPRRARTTDDKELLDARPLDAVVMRRVANHWNDGQHGNEQSVASTILTRCLPVEGLERHFRISLRGRFEVLACLAEEVPRERPKHSGNDFKPARWRNSAPCFFIRASGTTKGKSLKLK